MWLPCLPGARCCAVCVCALSHTVSEKLRSKLNANVKSHAGRTLPLLRLLQIRHPVQTVKAPAQTYALKVICRSRHAPRVIMQILRIYLCVRGLCLNRHVLYMRCDYVTATTPNAADVEEEVALRNFCRCSRTDEMRPPCAEHTDVSRPCAPALSGTHNTHTQHTCARISRASAHGTRLRNTCSWCGIRSSVTTISRQFSRNVGYSRNTLSTMI